MHANEAIHRYKLRLGVGIGLIVGVVIGEGLQSLKNDFNDSKDDIEVPTYHSGSKENQTILLEKENSSKTRYKPTIK